jgi:hypothetical protein
MYGVQATTSFLVGDTCLNMLVFRLTAFWYVSQILLAKLLPLMDEVSIVSICLLLMESK